ncbi:MAG TPA: hypothetical protein PLO31_05550 [Dysgonamonadaceae bacterium]|jgi:positive regulator of sigma E activity|nr:hypothetical protein [Dysgonamonadaceae bacterium]
MKASDLRDIFAIATLTGFAYLMLRSYRIRKKKERELKDFARLQLF